MLAKEALEIARRLSVDYHYAFSQLTNFNLQVDNNLEMQITFDCKLNKAKSRKLQNLLSKRKIKIEITDNKWKLS
jgi:hypothetical protein